MDITRVEMAYQEPSDPRITMSLPPGLINRSDGEGPYAVEDPTASMVPGLVVTSSSPTRELERDSPDRATVPVDPSKVPVQIGGRLQKMGRRFHRWNFRYFEIQGKHMYYYKTARKQHCLGEIDLSICFQCAPATAATFGHPFEIRSTQRSHILAARSHEDMKKWIEVICTNMSVSEKEAKNAKKAKVKRWESIFSRQKGSDVTVKPAAAARGKKKQAKPVDRNKSFMDRLKTWRRKERSRSRSPSSSPSPEREQKPTGVFHFQPGEPPPKSNRPLSDVLEITTLEVVHELPSSHSLPGTPIGRKREIKSDSPSSPSGPLSPLSPLTATSPEVSPAHVQKPPSSEVVPPSPETSPMKPVELVVPEYLQRRFVFDEIKEHLDSIPEKKEVFSYNELPPEEATWANEPTGIEQLRQFLAVCA